jgi:hypothetical protein
MVTWLWRKQKQVDHHSLPSAFSLEAGHETQEDFSGLPPRQVIISSFIHEVPSFKYGGCILYSCMKTE